MKTVVTFKSDAFNSSEQRDYFINPGCFGDDVAMWLMEGLQSRGLCTGAKPEQEDFGWYFTFRVEDTDHHLVIGYRPGDADAEGDWLAWIERKRGIIGSLLLGRTRGIRPAAARVVHEILATSPRIRDIRWYEKDQDESGTERP
jgi:hypothetical protein